MIWKQFTLCTTPPFKLIKNDRCLSDSLITTKLIDVFNCFLTYFRNTYLFLIYIYIQGPSWKNQSTTYTGAPTLWLLDFARLLYGNKYFWQHLNKLNIHSTQSTKIYISTDN